MTVGPHLLLGVLERFLCALAHLLRCRTRVNPQGRRPHTNSKRHCSRTNAPPSASLSAANPSPEPSVSAWPRSSASSASFCQAKPPAASPSALSCLRLLCRVSHARPPQNNFHNSTPSGQAHFSTEPTEAALRHPRLRSGTRARAGQSCGPQCQPPRAVITMRDR